MPFDKYKKAVEDFSLEHLQEYSGHLAQLERRSSYDDFECSSRYCMQALREAGFSQVERIAHPADGTTNSWDCIMPQAWDLVGRSTLQIVEGNVPEDSRMLADSNVNPLHALIWSAPTPPEGITCELISYDSLDAEKPDCQGKWVFYTCANGSSINTKVYHQLAAAGAAGLLVTGFSASESCPSALFWTNGQGRAGWYHSKGDFRLPCFAISPVRGRQLLRELASGPIKVHARMQSRIYDGEIFTVTAVVPGESEEEYALLAHVYEPFEADDAIGFAIGCDFGRQLLARKIKPHKTLRVIFSMELYGMAAFLSVPERREKIIGAMNLDVFTTNAAPELRLRFTPAAIASCLDWHWYDWTKKALPDTTIVPEFATLSDDTFCCDPQFGIPVNWLYTECGIFHHNTGPCFTPDWPKLKERLPVFYRALEEILLEELPDYSTRAAMDFRWAAKLITASNSLTNYERKVRFQTEYCRAVQRMKSQKRYSQTAGSLQKLKKVHAQFASVIASLPSDELSLAEKMAEGIVVGNCKYGFPFSLAHVPWSERRNVALPRALWALFDGKRTLLSAIRIFDAESSLPLLIDDNSKHNLAASRTSDKQIMQILNELRYVAQYGYCTLSMTTKP